MAFISLEGVHGAGKTNLANLLISELSDTGIDILFSKDQAGTPFSEAVRNINLDETTAVDIYTETFLVAAARRQTFVDVIAPALRTGRSVVTERFVDSFAAYGTARGLPLDFVAQIAHAASDGRLPDLTLLLDLDPAIGMQRIAAQKKHRIELEGLHFHRQLRAGYLAQAELSPERYVVIDASQPMDLVASLALEAIRNKTNISS